MVSDDELCGTGAGGERLTVDSMLKDPARIARQIAAMLEQKRVMDALGPWPRRPLSRRTRVKLKVWGARQRLAEWISPYGAVGEDD